MVIFHSPHPRLEDICSEMGFTNLNPSSTHFVMLIRAEGLANEPKHVTQPRHLYPWGHQGVAFLKLSPGSPGDNRDGVGTPSRQWKKLEPKKVREMGSKANSCRQFTRDYPRDKPELMLLCVVYFLNLECLGQV